MTEFKEYIQRGVLNFPKFVTPQSFSNEQNKFINDLEGGEFSTGLIVDKEALDTINERFNDFKNEFLKGEKYKQMTAKGILEIVDETNFCKIYEDKIELKFKRSAINKSGKKADIKYVDSYKKMLTPAQVEEIGSGTLAKVGFTIYSWAMVKQDRNKQNYISFGITLCLLAVQVLDLKSNSSIIDMFDEEEGYSADVGGIY